MRRFYSGAIGSVTASVLLTALVSLSVVGCGGSSGGGSASTSGSRAALDIYVTDGFAEAHKQVMVTLYKIQVTADGETYQTVWEDADGQTINLCSLASTAELLGSVNVATGSYKLALVTFADHFTLVSREGTSTSVAVDPTVATIANGQAVVTVSAHTEVVAGKTNTLLMDFKLAEFTLLGGYLRPHIEAGGADDLGIKERHGNLSGTVSNLVAGVSFSLQTKNGRTVTVSLTDTTLITSGETGEVVTLADGQAVHVEGTCDSTTGVLTATSVTLGDATLSSRTQAEGTVASVDGTSFVLTVEQGKCLATTTDASTDTVTVSTDDTTRFLKGHAKADSKESSTVSLTDVTVGSKVSVRGAMYATSKTIKATVVVIQ